MKFAVLFALLLTGCMKHYQACSPTLDWVACVERGRLDKGTKMQVKPAAPKAPKSDPCHVEQLVGCGTADPTAVAI